MDNKKKIKKDAVIDWQDKYLRAMADYQNLIKQKAKEQSELIKYANSGLWQDLLPVYSYLKLSLQHAPADNNSWVQGVQYVVKQFKEVLLSAGVQEIITAGQVFNHQTMEAMEEVATNDSALDHQVAQELSAGYTLHDRTLIPAKVSVYKYNLQKISTATNADIQ